MTALTLVEQGIDHNWCEVIEEQASGGVSSAGEGEKRTPIPSWFEKIIEGTYLPKYRGSRPPEVEAMIALHKQDVDVQTIVDRLLQLASSPGNQISKSRVDACIEEMMQTDVCPGGRQEPLPLRSMGCRFRPQYNDKRVQDGDILPTARGTHSKDS